MRSMGRVFLEYSLVGAAYGYTRKTMDMVFNEPEVTVERKYADGVYVTRNRSMLVTERIGVVALHVFIAPMYFPFVLGADVVGLEARMRGIDLAPSPTSRDRERTFLTHVIS